MLMKYVKVSYILYSASFIIITITSLYYYEQISYALSKREFLYSEYILLFGFLLWIIIAVPCFLFIKKNSNKIEGDLPYLYIIIPLLLFIFALLLLWLHIFNSPSSCKKLALILLFNAPLFALADSLILMINIKNRLKFTVYYFDTFQNIFTNTVITISSLLFLTMILEISFRFITDYKPGFIAAYGTRDYLVLSPYLMFAEPSKANGGTLNSQGFQGHELSLTKEPNEIRIAVLGGSAAWSGGRKNSIAGYLEKYIKAHYPAKHVKVVNWGRQAYVSAQELILLQRNILPLSFDLIIVYDGFNDIWFPWTSEPLGVGYPYLFSDLKKRVELQSEFINFNYFFNYMSTKSAIFNYIKQRSEKGPISKSKEKKEGWGFPNFDIQKCATEYGRNLYQMAILAKAYNARIIFSTQPFVGTKNPRIGKEKSFVSSEDLELLKGYYEKIVNTAKNVANQTESLYISTLSVFDGINEEIFYDGVHIYVDKGNPIVAKKLADEINRLKIFQ